MQAPDATASEQHRAFHERALQRKLEQVRRDCGVAEDVGQVPGQVARTTELYAQKGQLMSMLVIHSLRAGFLVRVSSHCIWPSAPIARFLEENPDYLRQILQLKVNRGWRHPVGRGSPTKKPSAALLARARRHAAEVCSPP